MRIKFYDVGQGLAVLVTLPDGRHIVVDTGVLPDFPACAPCKSWSQRYLEALARDVPDHRLNTVFITHQHADHNGNTDAVLRDYAVEQFIDNGTARNKKRIALLHEMVSERGVPHRVVDPEHAESPWRATDALAIAPVVPDAWPVRCDHDPNNCSIGLRIDYCQSSVLLTGDAEEKEEAALTVAPATLLQVAHHGSDSSSTLPFLRQAKPSYAVISSGRRGEGTNARYCHPRKTTIERLGEVLPGPRDRALWAFAGASCREDPGAWEQVTTSRHLYATARDGHLVFTTTGDGAFEVSSEPR